MSLSLHLHCHNCKSCLQPVMGWLFYCSSTSLMRSLQTSLYNWWTYLVHLTNLDTTSRLMFAGCVMMIPAELHYDAWEQSNNCHFNWKWVFWTDNADEVVSCSLWGSNNCRLLSVFLTGSASSWYDFGESSTDNISGTKTNCFFVWIPQVPIWLFGFVLLLTIQHQCFCSMLHSCLLGSRHQL